MLTLHNFHYYGNKETKMTPLNWRSPKYDLLQFLAQSLTEAELYSRGKFVL